MNTRRISLPDSVNRLTSRPDKKNWSSFRKSLPGSDIAYYHVVYPSRVNGIDDLESAYIILYDSKYDRRFRIPVYVKDGVRINGALSYLKGLSINRRLMKHGGIT